LDVAKELHAKGEGAFVEEAGAKAMTWWNQSGRSEAFKMKETWVLDKTKRTASASLAAEPATKRHIATAIAPPPAGAGGAGARC